MFYIILSYKRFAKIQHSYYHLFASVYLFIQNAPHSVIFFIDLTLMGNTINI